MTNNAAVLLEKGMVKINNEWTLRDLNEVQRQHLAWRLDHKTYCGLLTACSIARLEHDKYNDMPLYQLFMDFDMTERAAKIHACKVISFCAQDVGYGEVA